MSPILSPSESLDAYEAARASAAAPVADRAMKVAACVSLTACAVLFLTMALQGFELYKGAHIPPLWHFFGLANR